MEPSSSCIDGVRWYSGTLGLGFFDAVEVLVGEAFRFIVLKRINCRSVGTRLVE